MEPAAAGQGAGDRELPLPTPLVEGAAHETAAQALLQSSSGSQKYPGVLPLPLPMVEGARDNRELPQPMPLVKGTPAQDDHEKPITLAQAHNGGSHILPIPLPLVEGAKAENKNPSEKALNISMPLLHQAQSSISGSRTGDEEEAEPHELLPLENLPIDMLQAQGVVAGCPNRYLRCRGAWSVSGRVAACRGTLWCERHLGQVR